MDGREWQEAPWPAIGDVISIFNGMAAWLEDPDNKAAFGNNGLEGHGDQHLRQEGPNHGNALTL